MAYIPWIRGNGFVLGLIAGVALAFLFPEPGSRAGVLHPELTNNVGIALILFLQGLSLAMHEVRRGAGNWRLHAMIQSFTFIVFPAVGLLLHGIIPQIWTGEPEAIQRGFLYLCVLPSTISTSVVLTAVARGNTAGALFNAALSNILGVFLTPLLVQWLMRTTGETGPIGLLLTKIVLLTLVPFFAGMFLRRICSQPVEILKPWVPRISNTIIVFIVYTAFCDSVQERVWDQHGLTMTTAVLAWVVVLFGIMSALALLACRALKLSRDDRIAAYFCAVKKTLAMGVPLAVLIFGDRSDLSLILLPIMFYHPLQLLANSLLAGHWARQPHED